MDENNSVNQNRERRAVPSGKTLKDNSESADWRRVESVPCVECPHCLFTFAAEHTDGYSNSYSCPNCNDGAPCGWQPIESAPKDGTHILFAREQPWSSSANVCVGFWADEHQADFPHWKTENGFMVDDRVYRLWMPLPAAPEVNVPE